MPPRKDRKRNRSFPSDLQLAIRNEYIKQLHTFQIYKIDGIVLDKCTTDELKYRLAAAHIRSETAQIRKGGA